MELVNDLGSIEFQITRQLSFRTYQTRHVVVSSIYKSIHKKIALAFIEMLRNAQSASEPLESP
jgi:hypothetical protein